MIERTFFYQNVFDPLHALFGSEMLVENQAAPLNKDIGEHFATSCDLHPSLLTHAFCS